MITGFDTAALPTLAILPQIGTKYNPNREIKVRAIDLKHRSITGNSSYHHPYDHRPENICGQMARYVTLRHDT